MASYQWQLLQLMTVDTPYYSNSGGFYKIGGTCLRQLDNIYKYMYHTLFLHLILLIFIIHVWPWCIWCYLVTALLWRLAFYSFLGSLCGVCTWQNCTQAELHWVLVVPTGRLLLSEMLCCILVIQQSTLGRQGWESVCAFPKLLLINFCFLMFPASFSS